MTPSPRRCYRPAPRGRRRCREGRARVPLLATLALLLGVGSAGHPLAVAGRCSRFPEHTERERRGLTETVVVGDLAEQARGNLTPANCCELLGVQCFDMKHQTSWYAGRYWLTDRAAAPIDGRKWHNTSNIEMHRDLRDTCWHSSDVLNLSGEESFLPDRKLQLLYLSQYKLSSVGNLQRLLHHSQLAAHRAPLEDSNQGVCRRGERDDSGEDQLQPRDESLRPPPIRKTLEVAAKRAACVLVFAAAAVAFLLAFIELVGRAHLLAAVVWFAISALLLAILGVAGPDFVVSGLTSGDEHVRHPGVLCPCPLPSEPRIVAGLGSLYPAQPAQWGGLRSAVLGENKKYDRRFAPPDCAMLLRSQFVDLHERMLHLRSRRQSEIWRYLLQVPHGVFRFGLLRGEWMRNIGHSRIRPCEPSDRFPSIPDSSRGVDQRLGRNLLASQDG